MPSEEPTLPENQRRRRRRRRPWSTCIPRSLSGLLVDPSCDGTRLFGQDRKTSKASCFPWLPSLRRVRRSLSVSRGVSVVAPEVEANEGEEKADAQPINELPEIVLAAVRPTFLQRLFRSKGARRRGPKPEARTLMISPQGDQVPSEMIIIPNPPSSPNDHLPIVTTSHSSPQHNTLHRAAAASPRQAAGPSSPAVKPTPAATPRPRCDKKACELMAKSDSLAGFGTTVVMLLMLAVGGRTFAILSTCAFFYLSSYLKASPKKSDAAASADRREEKHSNAAISRVVDYESEEYRKRVLLEGLLERNGRRAARA